MINDFNSLTESNRLSSALLKWTSEANCHITGVLHKNFGTSKPVGHIGSAILKKAETVAFVARNQENPQVYDVTCAYSRNYPFDAFQFEIGDDHLPRKAQAGFSLGGGGDIF